MATVALGQVDVRTVRAGGVANISNTFIIGVDLQPASSFTTWRSRGINTAVRRRDPISTFDASAVAADLNTIRDAQSPSSLDANNPALIATLWRDEPETNAKAFCDYNTLRDQQSAQKSANSGSGVAFFTNYAGPWIMNDVPAPSPCSNADGTPRGDWCGIRNDVNNQWCYGELFRATNWISFDVYPMNDGYSIDSLTTVMNKIYGVYPGGGAPPILAYIEASNRNCDSTYPNQWHMVYEAVEALIAGARGIIYFPHALAGCATQSPDGTTTAIQNEMTRLDAALSTVPGTTMQGTVNPSGVWFESGTTTGQIKSGTRSDGVNAYFFTENDSGSADYTHVVRFHGINNCAGKTVVALDDSVTSNSPYIFVDRTFQLDAFCQSVAPEGWSPYRYHIYQVPIT